MKSLLTILIKVYQKTLGLFLPDSCRFYPSCSNYALEALKRYPFLRAFLLIMKRLTRCHPWHPGGVDLVPDRPQKTGKQKTRE